MDDLSTYPYLFDRRRAAHPWLPSLDELQRGDFPESQALARNWRMDHRVSKDRESEMADSGLFPDSANPAGRFGVAVSGYFRNRLCVPAALTGTRSPAYATVANAANRIAPDRISPNQQLLHLASLNALLPRILREADLQLALFDLTGEYAPEHDEIAPENVESIALALQSAGAEAVCEFAGLISDQLGPTEPHWWAAFAFEVDEYLQGDDWTTAARILGIGHLLQGRWLIAWRYSPELAGPLFRPTVAEAGEYGYHFPSPPGKRSV